MPASLSLLAVPVTADDFDRARSSRRAGLPSPDCLPLTASLRRNVRHDVQFTRKFIRLGADWFVPRRATRESERRWLQTQQGEPYLAILEQRLSCRCGRPARFRDSYCAGCRPAAVDAYPFRDPSVPRRRPDFDGELRAVVERIQERFANWPA